MSHWRLGLDVGSNSVGWAAVELDGNGAPVGLMDAGVRVFSDGRDPQDKQSLAVQRRLPRGLRRNRDRKLDRRARFMDALVRYGLLPRDPAERKALENPVGSGRNGPIEARAAYDPWCLRARGLDDPLTPQELGRALFHLQQRRGFKSNRKLDKSDGDKGKIAAAQAKTREALKDAGAETLGALFGRRRLRGDPNAATRARLHGSGATAFYDFYPTRDLILAEFDALWRAQAHHHPDLMTEAARTTLRDILAFQRPLKPQPIGRCTLEPMDLRAPWALPSCQRRRVFETINSLRFARAGEAAQSLTTDQRDLLAAKALDRDKLTFDAMRKALGFGDDVTFKHEAEDRPHIYGDRTGAVLSGRTRWGKGWRALPLPVQDAVVEILIGLEPVTERTPEHIRTSTDAIVASVAAALDLDGREAEHWLTATDPDALADWLAARFDLDREAARRIVDAPLPEGHQAFGRRANAEVLRALEAEVITYDKAVAAAGYPDHRAVHGPGVIRETLPYYGAVLQRAVAFGSGDPDDPEEKRVGKLANPSVHVALNQIRKAVNRVIKRHGKPAQIVVELARDLPLSAKGKSDLEREQKDNRQANDRRRATLTQHGAADTPVNRLKLRLYDELPIEHRQCALTGQAIGVSRLLSDEIEIDHILPFARTLDDGFANKILVTRKANREKGRRSPYEAFGQSPPGYDWAAITARAADLPPSKTWRFGPDAMERFEDQERDFLARQLTDTKYIARLTHAYLGALYGGGDQAAKQVWVTPGRLTSDLRRVWGLNTVLAGGNRPDDADAPIRKNRDDHRHHAIDAVVVALTDRALLQRVANHARRMGPDVGPERVLADLADPWPDFRDDVARGIRRLTVSHRKDHGLAGALHEDTAYGVVRDPRTQDNRLATRKPIVGLTENEIDQIGDRRIREELAAHTAGLTGKAFTAALHAYVNADKPGRRTNPRRVRIHKPFTKDTPAKVIRHGPDRRFEKTVLAKEVYCLDIYDDGTGRWACAGISRFDANRPDGPILSDAPAPWQAANPQARLVMRLRKNDTLAIDDTPGHRRLMQVVRLEPSANRVRLAEHFEAGQLDNRHKDPSDLFRWDLAAISKLKDRAARLVHVDEAGRVYDPGPHHAGTNSGGGD